MDVFWSGSLVAADDTWVLWTIIIVFASASIYLEQNYKWAEKLSGPVIGLIFAVIAVNLGIIPTAAGVYDAIWDYCIPLSVVMLLFRANLKSIFRDTGKMFFCFNLSAIGTLLGVVVAFFALKNFIPELDRMGGILTGSYIGGGVNLFAVASSVKISETLLSAELIADNFVMALVIFTLLWIPSSDYFKARFRHPFQAKIEEKGVSKEAKTMTAVFWGKKEMSLLDIAMTVATAFVVATVSTKLAAWFKVALAVPAGGDLWSTFPAMIFGNQFVILTIMSVLLTSIFPKFFESLKGGQEIGTFLIYTFFVVIGCPALLKDVIFSAPLLFIFCGLVAFINIGWTLLCGKLLRQNIEELTIASNASIGGPPTAAAMAVAKGYGDLVVPGILVGLWGYIIGTPLGLFMFQWLSQFMDK
ncbi:membrane protein [Synergistales bacterium]|nr:membrane protein [Synergistales bacterium]